MKYDSSYAAVRARRANRNAAVDHLIAPRKRAHAFRMFRTGVDECAFCGKSRKEH